MSYITDPKGAQFGLFKTDTDPSDFTMCGQRFHTEDGREIVLIENADKALVSGVLTQQAPVDTNYVDLSVVTYTPVDVQTGIPASFTCVPGAFVTNQNIFAGGLVVVTGGTGIGQTLRIASSSPTASLGTLTVTLEDAATIDLDNTSTVTLTLPQYTGIVVHPTTATAVPAGATLYPIPASVLNTYDGTTGALATVGTPSFGFIVVQGMTGVLSDVAPAAVGGAVIPSVTTAGCVTVMTAASITPIVGVAEVAGVSAEVQPVFLNL